jgi:hypothetical protein
MSRVCTRGKPLSSRPGRGARRPGRHHAHVAEALLPCAAVSHAPPAPASPRPVCFVTAGLPQGHRRAHQGGDRDH